MVRQPRRQPRTGSILPLLVVSLIALVGMIALAIDIGLVAIARTQAQDIADLTALTGARLLNGDASNSSNLNNVGTAISTAKAQAGYNTILGQAVTPAMLTIKSGIYTYDGTSQRFTASYPGSPGSNAWSVMDVTLNATTPTYFGRLFNISSFNLTANATAVHRPRDVALILDFSGSMKFGSESAYYLTGWSDLAGSLNSDPVYPKFGHYYAISQRPLASSQTGPTTNGTGYNPMQRTVLFQDSGGETHAASNLTATTSGGPPVVQDFLTQSGSGKVNAFHKPQSAGSYNPNQTPVAMPAPDNFQDQSDSPDTYAGDKWPRKSKATSGNNWAATLMEYWTGSNTTLADNHQKNSGLSGGTAWEGTSNANGYGANFKGYSMGPGYYGKTFWIWPPDPRWTSGADPTRPSTNSPATDVNGRYICDWRKRFFTYPGSSTPLDDNSLLFDSNGYIQPPAGRYGVNYKAILAWLKAGPQVLPPNLRAGRVLYYSAIPTDIPSSGSLTLDQLFWKQYIDYVLGIDSAYGYYLQGKRSLYGTEPAGWGTVRITPKANLYGGGTNASSPYMQYNDNPIRPRAHFWFGPLSMVMFLTTDGEFSPNMWAGTLHESHCWQLKAGVNSALDDIKVNHPNDWATLIFFSGINSYATPRVTLGRNYSRMKNALFFPFSLLDSLGDDTAEIRPYDSSFSYTGSGDIPNADGSTTPGMAFMAAYNQFSSANGSAGRRGATKMVIFETDGVPNTASVGTFVNGGAYSSYYNNIGVGSYASNGDNAVESACLDVVRQICALDTAANPGYSTSRNPARVHALAFGDLFETTNSTSSGALDFLLQVQKAGNTSTSSDTSIESYKIITGNYATRIDNIRQAFERIMQSGIQVSLIR